MSPGALMVLQAVNIFLFALNAGLAMNRDDGLGTALWGVGALCWVLALIGTASSS